MWLSEGGALIFWERCYQSYFNLTFMSNVFKWKPFATSFLQWDVCSGFFSSDASERYLMLRVLSAASLWTAVSFLTVCDDGLLVVSHTVNSFEESAC